MMTPDELRKKVLEEFDSAGLLQFVELGASSFRELSQFFEVSHLAMRLALNDVAAVGTASRIAAKLKRDLQQQGIELEYGIAAQWKVSGFSTDALEPCEDGSWMPAESFCVELQSGSAKRLAGVRMSNDTEEQIRQYLCQIPISDQQKAIYALLEACLNRQLASTGLGHWDPVLYPNRTIGAEEVAQSIQSGTDSKDQELASSRI